MDNGCDKDSGAVCEDTTPGYRCSCTANPGLQPTPDGFGCIKCGATNWGYGCNETCSTCQNRAKRCDAAIGCTDCYPGWTGEQCKTNTNECTEDPNICGDNSEVVLYT